MELLCIAAFVMIWGSGSIFVKLGLAHASVLDFLVLRALIATVCFFVIWLINRSIKLAKKEFIPAISWQQLLLIAGTGLLLQVIYQASFFYALQYYLSPGLLMILLGTQPIFTAMIMADRLTKANWLGLFLGLFGLCLVVFNTIFVIQLNLLGIVFGLTALMAMTFGTIAQKRFCCDINFTTNLLLQYLISTTVFLLIDKFHIFRVFSYNTEFIVALFWMGLVVSVIATCLYYYLVNAKQLTNVTTIFYGVPVVAVILDYIIYGQLISVVTLIGFCITCVGLYFSLQFNIANRKLPLDTEEII